MDAPSAVGIYRPRYFWRRFLAFCVDLLLCWVALSVIFALATDDNLNDDLTAPETSVNFGASISLGEFRPWLYIGTKTCGGVGTLGEDLAAYMAPAKITSAEACFERSFGLAIGGTASLQVADTPEAAAIAGQTVDLPLRIHGLRGWVDVLALGLFLVMSVFSLSVFRTTPGKHLLGLYVAATGPVPALRREVLRSLPHILSVGVVAVIGWFGTTPAGIMPWANPLAVVVQLAALAAALYLWIVPLLRWRGTLPYDRWLGLHVRRNVDDPSPFE